VSAAGVIGAVMAVGWLAATVSAARARRFRLAAVTAGVACLQAACVGLPALGPVVIVAWACVLLTIPSGRFVGTGRRLLAVAFGAGALSWSVTLAAAGTGAAAGALTGLAGGCLAVVTAVGLIRWPRLGEQSRWAVSWAAAGGVIAVATGGGAGAAYLLLDVPSRPVVAAMAGWVALPAALAVGLSPRTARLGPRALVEAFVVAGLVGFVAAVYLVAIIGLGRPPAGGERDVLALSLAAAFVVATLAMPVRTRLIEAAERVLGGAGPSPQELLATFGTRMTRAVPLDELLLQLAELLRATLGPAGAEVWAGTGGVLTRTVSVPERPTARLVLAEREQAVAARARAVGRTWLAMWMPDLLADSSATGPTRVAPVTHAGQLLGLLVVRRVADAAPFADADDRVLVDLARQVGLALHNVNLDTALQASLAELKERNAELQASRARIVSAADASRRTIERDLHDGAQQHLVALAVRLGLATQIVEADPRAATTLLDELRGDVRAAAAAMRELAHGIYPPLLRDHGLAKALAAAAGRCPLGCSVEVSPDGLRYDAEVEAAVYFCCLEALQNAGKHAGPEARVRVTVDVDAGELRFAVVDDGAGFEALRLAGHGFVNMRDRLGAMGGRLEVTSSPGAGTAVRGFLPVHSGAAP
jgi:signal transduction histidine kinase